MDVPVGLKKAAVLVVLKSSKGLLLLLRTKEPHGGKYIPVGGRIEPFENPKTAAEREVREEAELLIPNLRLAGIMTETSPTKFNWINYVYSAEIDPVEVRDCDEGSFHWIAEDKLPTVPTPATDRFIYDFVARSRFFVLDAEYDKRTDLVRLVDELSGNVLLDLQATVA